MSGTNTELQRWVRRISAVPLVALAVTAWSSQKAFSVLGVSDEGAGAQRTTSQPARHQLRPVAAGGSRAEPVATCVLAAAATVLAVTSLRRRDAEPAVVCRGLKDRVKKPVSVKSAMIRTLGKWRLMKEFDMRKQIQDDPLMAERLGKTQEELVADFEHASKYLINELGCEEQLAEICIAKVSIGLNLQFLGKPLIPSDNQMTTVLTWLTQNLAVRKEDGSLKRSIEQYPFVLGRTIPELEESRRFCPADIDFQVAVADDPALIDKTYNCDGICASQCVACWYNG